MTVTNRAILKNASFDLYCERIVTLFPELKSEVPKEKIEKVLNFIAYKQDEYDASCSKKFTKKETNLPFIVYFHNGNVYLEIKRTKEDRAKDGGQSKYFRMIGIVAKTGEIAIERFAGLKPKISKDLPADKHNQKVEKRIQKIKTIQEYPFDPKYVAHRPEAIITCQKIGKEKVEVLFVWEYLGQELGKTSKNENWDFKTIVKSLVQAAKAIENIDANGFFDRDIKPDNFMVKRLDNGEIQVKKIDLGFAILKEDVKPYEDKTGAISGKGTLSHMDTALLEKMNGELNVFVHRHNEQREIYSFGKTMFDILEKTIFYPEIDHQILCLQQKITSCLYKEVKKAVLDEIIIMNNYFRRAGEPEIEVSEEGIKNNFIFSIKEIQDRCEALRKKKMLSITEEELNKHLELLKPLIENRDDLMRHFETETLITEMNRLIDEENALKKTFKKNSEKVIKPKDALDALDDTVNECVTYSAQMKEVQEKIRQFQIALSKTEFMLLENLIQSYVLLKNASTDTTPKLGRTYKICKDQMQRWGSTERLRGSGSGSGSGEFKLKKFEKRFSNSSEELKQKLPVELGIQRSRSSGHVSNAPICDIFILIRDILKAEWHERPEISSVAQQLETLESRIK